MNKYEIIKELSRGSYGQAFLARVKGGKRAEFVVMKQLQVVNDGHGQNKQNLKSALKEAETLKQFSNHSNIIQYIDSFVDQATSSLWIVMDYAEDGDLSNQIQRLRQSHRRWSENEIMRMFIQICLALRYVHSHGIMHRDIKSKNIFLTKRGIVKLGDFGISRPIENTFDGAHTQIGTPYYLSPEICENKPYGKKSDVWSLGVLLYEICAQRVPFEGDSFLTICNRIISADPSPLPNHYSKSMQHLVTKLLSKKPKDRPSISQILKLSFVQKHVQSLVSLSSRKAGIQQDCDAAYENSRKSESSNASSSSSSLNVPSPNNQKADILQTTSHKMWKDSFALASDTVVIKKISIVINSDAGANSCPTHDKLNKEITEPRELQEKELARRMYFENRLAAQRNRNRFIEEEMNSPKFSFDSDTDQEKEKDVKRKSHVIEKSDENFSCEARVLYVQNREAAKCIRDKVNEQLGRYSPGVEHTSQVYDQPDFLVWEENPNIKDTKSNDLDKQSNRQQKEDERLKELVEAAKQARGDRRNIIEKMRKLEDERIASLHTDNKEDWNESSSSSFLSIMPPPAPTQAYKTSQKSIYEDELAKERRKIYLDRKALKAKYFHEKEDEVENISMKDNPIYKRQCIEQCLPSKDLHHIIHAENQINCNPKEASQEVLNLLRQSLQLANLN